MITDCSGWQNLETSYAAYRALIEGYGGRYVHLIYSPASSPGAWSTLIGTAGGHLNRYVRQAACELIGVIGQCSLAAPPPPLPPHHGEAHTAAASPVTCAVTALLSMQEKKGEEEVKGEETWLHPPVGLLAQVLATGLEDSWCQVRLAATQAAGVLLRWVKHLCPLPSSSSSSDSLEVTPFVPFWLLLVPRLCLNRHYSTDSVRYLFQKQYELSLLYC